MANKLEPMQICLAFFFIAIFLTLLLRGLRVRFFKPKKMSKKTYYRIIKREFNDGKTVFKVQEVNSLFDLIFGFWVTYTYENETKEEALEHIELIHKRAIKKDKEVYRTKKNR